MIQAKQRLRMDLENLGICPGDIVLVHASMKAIHTYLSPVAVLLVLQDAVGTNGTVLFPTLTYNTVTEQTPYFDSERNMACTGILPRTFQLMPNVYRSVHPTHSVAARGASAAALTANHLKDNTPVGPNSPFMQLVPHGGKLLFIGDVVNCCTFMHGVEEDAAVPYVLRRDPVLYRVNGVELEYYPHNFVNIAAQCYSRIKALPDVGMRTGNLGKAPCWVFEAAPLFKRAKEKLLQNPYHFVNVRVHCD